MVVLPPQAQAEAYSAAKQAEAAAAGATQAFKDCLASAQAVRAMLTARKATRAAAAACDIAKAAAERAQEKTDHARRHRAKGRLALLKTAGFLTGSMTIKSASKVAAFMAAEALQSAVHSAQVRQQYSDGGLFAVKHG